MTDDSHIRSDREAALADLQPLLKAKKAGNAEVRQERIEEWTEALDGAKTYAQLLTDLVETVEEAISEAENAENRDEYHGAVDSLRDAAEELINNLDG